MKYARCVIISGMLLCFASCVTDSGSSKGSHIFFDATAATDIQERKSPENIIIFYKNTPEEKFLELGLVEAVVRGESVGLQDLFPELKKQAAEMNADAVYKIELQRYDSAGEALYATGVAIRLMKTED